MDRPDQMDALTGSFFISASKSGHPNNIRFAVTVKITKCEFVRLITGGIELFPRRYTVPRNVPNRAVAIKDVRFTVAIKIIEGEFTHSL